MKHVGKYHVLQCNIQIWGREGPGLLPVPKASKHRTEDGVQAVSFKLPGSGASRTAVTGTPLAAAPPLEGALPCSAKACPRDQRARTGVAISCQRSSPVTVLALLCKPVCLEAITASFLTQLKHGFSEVSHLLLGMRRDLRPLAGRRGRGHWSDEHTDVFSKWLNPVQF